MKSSTVKSKYILPDERSRVGVVWDMERGDWLRFTQTLDGRLDGFTAELQFEMVEDRPALVAVQYQPSHPMPLDRATNRALQDLRLGDVKSIIERCLENMGDPGLPWLTALRRDRSLRPGKSKTPDVVYADIARRRLEAEERWPGSAIRHMVIEWPDVFSSKSAAHAKVNRAIKRGLLELDPVRLTPKAHDLLSAGEQHEGGTDGER